MKRVENKAMLITYADALGPDLPSLERVLDTYFPDVFGGIHILPFYPSSGDHGFAVIRYDTVDPAFGSWADIDRLAEKYYLMADFMINHASIRSDEFQNYMTYGDASPYRSMFLDWNRFWPNGEPTQEEFDALYRRNARCWQQFTRRDGKEVKLWNTFFEEQIDLDARADATKTYYAKNLGILAAHVPLVRLDAFAYASKRPGTSCFFVEPEIWQVLQSALEPLRKTGTEILPEIHENYHYQFKMAEKGYWVYDFALPMLLLHALYSSTTDRLIHWLQICPRKQFTTLDTHDGIGVVDVAGLLTEEEIRLVQDKVDTITQPARPFLKIPPSLSAGGERRRYQLGCTYYDACGSSDRAYLLARAVQLFAPGIPQIYYVGLLAGSNDIEALKRGGEPRSINRHPYTEREIREAARRQVVKDLCTLLRFRNTCPAFNGNLEVVQTGQTDRLTMRWTNGSCTACLDASFAQKCFQITCRNADTTRIVFTQN